jgi:tetratricopeptide (TPR) repeat protein
VDIWALGCIVHELAIGTPPFPNDWATKEFAEGSQSLELAVPFPPFFKRNVQDILDSLLHRDWKLRPRASDISVIFLSSLQLLGLGLIDVLSNLNFFHDLYSKWKPLTLKTLMDWEILFFFIIGLDYTEDGSAAATVIWEKLIQEPITQKMLRGVGMKAPYSTLLGLSLEDCIARIYLNQGNYGQAINTYAGKIDDAPLCLRLWHGLFAIQVATTGLERAITIANQYIKKNPTNPCPDLALTTLYAAQGDYTTALRVYTEIFNNRVVEKSKNLSIVTEDIKKEPSYVYHKKRSTEEFALR